MYTIRVLPEDKFNKLPYKHTEESLGLADYKNKKAYVRESGIPALDLLVMGHELQELVSKVSPHEEDGIRYKKGGAARTIVPMILGAALAPFTGGTSLWWVPAVVGALSGAGMGAYAGSRHPEQLGGAGTGALTGGATGLLSGFGAGQLVSGGIAGGSSAAPGFLSKAGGIAQGALLGTGTAAAPAGVGTAARVPVAFQGAGLFGPGTIGGSLASGSLGKSALTMLGGNAVSNMLNPAQTQSQAMDYNAMPAWNSGFSSALANPGVTQSIRSTQPLTEGFTSAQKYNLFSDNTDQGNSVIPGLNRAYSLLAQRNPLYNLTTFGGY